MSLKDKIIAFDLDGTLARNNAVPSDYTFKELARLVSEGYKITFVTGRAIISSIDIYQKAKANIPYVCCYGSLIYDPINNRKIIENNIPLELVNKILDNQQLMDKVDDILAEYDFTSYAHTGKIYQGAMIKGNLKDNLKIAPSTFVFYLKNHDDQLFFKETIEKMTDNYKYQYWHYQAELSNVVCNKTFGTAKLLEYLNKNFEDLVYFGDSSPDLPLIEKASIGIAMKNACQEIKDAADYVTDYSNDEDGAIKFLLKLIEQENG